MATVKELLRAENDGTLSFGDYTLPTKTKKDNFESLYNKSISFSILIPLSSYELFMKK